MGTVTDGRPADAVAQTSRRDRQKQKGRPVAAGLSLAVRGAAARANRAGQS